MTKARRNQIEKEIARLQKELDDATPHILVTVRLTERPLPRFYVGEKVLLGDDIGDCGDLWEGVVEVVV